MEWAIEVQNLHRDYVSDTGGFVRRRHIQNALRGVTFSVHSGEIFGILGPNGAGKTTIIKILSTMLLPTAGTALVLGADVRHRAREIRPRINVIFGGERSLYWRLTGRENLRYFSDLYRVPDAEQRQRIPELLRLVGLEQKADLRVETYSKGMKQRLQIARGLVNRPWVLFLDEPSIGLDPVSAAELRRILLTLASQGTTMVLTTHYMFEAEQLCSRIAIIDQGQVRAIDSPEGLKDLTVGRDVIEVERDVRGEPPNFADIPGVRHVTEFAIGQRLLVSIQSDDPGAVETYLRQQSARLQVLAVRRRAANLEDAYLQLVEGA